MGRIDEALRRAGGDTGTPVRVSAQQADFVSAWSDEELRSAPRRVPDLTPAPARIAVEEAPESLLTTGESGVLPALTSAWGERLISASHCNALLVEQFRRLAAVLHQLQVANGTKIVMVTSAAPSDGKTLTALNLALSLSGSYKRHVLLVDADLRRPSIANSLGLQQSSGLSEALKAGKEHKLPIVPITPTLTILPSGRPDPDPLAGLTSARMRRILEEAAARFDWVIVDAPPLGLLVDANLMAAQVDRSVLVIRAGETPYAQVQKAIEAIGRERLVGVVLNAVDARASGHYDRYAYASPRP